MNEDFKLIEDVNLDEKNVITEFNDIIEYEIEEYISLLYSKNEKKFYIEFVDYEDSFDEFNYEIDDTFDGMQCGSTFISKQDYNDFKKLIEEVA